MKRTFSHPTTFTPHSRGLSLVETVVAVAIFALVAFMLYTTYQRVFTTVRFAQARINATLLANEQFEIVRNLPYADVGIVSGIPVGKLPPVKILVRGGMTFIATTTVRNIDLPFDGTVGGIPGDLSPADNKLVEIEMACFSCGTFRPLLFTTTVAPKDLESASTNGALFVRAMNAVGQPISGANVHVFNGSGTTTIDINDLTASSGMLQIVDAPPAAEAYQITVTKPGYSIERTYPLASPTTNPTKPHATVLVQTVTQLTFAIDQLATLHLSSVSPSCAVVPNVRVALAGAKLISTTPDLRKYDAWHSTGVAGTKTLSDVEWDTYTLTASTSGYDLAGVMPLSPIAVTPGATQNIQLIMVPKNAPSVLVTVKDNATGLPISGATVILEKDGIEVTQVTGRGFLSQTDWSGGSGQDAFVDTNRYDSGDANIDPLTTPGEVKLLDFLGQYPENAWLTSSTFDTGSVSNFYQLTSQPMSQPPEVGPSSVRFQLATGNATTSWTYLGPDGTAETYYTATATDIGAVHSGDRYLRYKMYLATASTTFTPNVSDVQFTFTSLCVPPGQVIFQGLSVGTWNVTVSQSGYSPYSGTLSVAPGTWQEKQVNLSP